MKSNDQVGAEQDRQSATQWPAGRVPLVVVFAIAWLVGFSIWFHHFDLHNSHAPRWMIWTAIPFDMLDLVDPPVQPGSAPWSWFFLAQRIPFFCIAVCIWIAAWGYGSLILRLIGPKLPGCEWHFFAMCLGLSSVSLVMLSLGLCGRLMRWPLIISLAVPCVVEAVIRARRPPCVASDPLTDQSSRRTHWSRFGWVVAICMAPFVFGMFLGAMSPQTDFDVVEYHLGGPKEWFQRGQIVRLPHNVYTNFPFLSEMLILAGMVLYGDWQWGALAGQAVTAGFAPLTALGLFAAGRRWFSEATGWLAALVYLTSPWTYRISIIAYAEGGLSCYLFAALYALLLFRDQILDTEPRAAERRWRFALLAGLLAGSAMACKYTGLVSVVIPIEILLTVIALRDAHSARLRHTFETIVAYSLGVCAAIGPWLLKNLIATGNPVYPLAVQVFGGIDRDPELDAKWIHAHAAKTYETWGDRLTDFFVKLADVTANNDWHSPLMFALAPLSLIWCLRQRRGDSIGITDNNPQRSIVTIVWLYVAWQFLTWWILTHHIDRFYVPMFSAVALLAAAGASWRQARLTVTTSNHGVSELQVWRASEGPWFRNSGGTVLIWNWCLGTVIAASLLYNGELMSQGWISGFNAGRLDLRAARDIAVAPRVKWLNDEYESGRLPRNTKVLCVGEALMFHARYPYLYNTVFDRSLFESICADPNSSDHQLRPAMEIRAEFRRLGITLIDVNWAEILRYREPGNYGYTDFVNPERFKELQRMGLLGPALNLPTSMTLEPLVSDLQERLKQWAPSLITSYEGKPAYIKAQIYPVIQGNTD